MMKVFKRFAPIFSYTLRLLKTVKYFYKIVENYFSMDNCNSSVSKCECQKMFFVSDNSNLTFNPSKFPYKNVTD